MSDFLLGIFYICMVLGIFVGCGRLIGWALGISEVRKQNEKQVDQNEEIIELLEQLKRIQIARAKHEGLTVSEE